jgi:hypothetical protein
MRNGSVRKLACCFVSFSFFSLASGLPALAAESSGVPIAEMVSNGEVRLGTRQIQGGGASSVFAGTTVTTGKGVATLRLANNTQLGLHANSSLSLDQIGRFTLLKGAVEFYVPPFMEARIQSGSVSILKAPVQQVAKGSGPVSDEASYGVISIEPSGSVKVNNVQGKVSILNAKHTVLAAVGPRESATVSPGEAGRVLLAQAGNPREVETSEPKEFLGLSSWEWVGAGAIAAVAGGGIAAAASSGGGGSSGGHAACE